MFYSPSRNAFFPADLRGDYESHGTWPNDAREISDELYSEVVTNRPTNKMNVPGTDGLPILVDPPAPLLADVLAASLAAIDTAAGAARSRYITTVPGQEATYLIKAQQARDYQAAGHTGTVPSLVQAEADATGETPQLACGRILAEEAAWIAKAAQIETARRRGKIAAQAAADVPAVEAARDVAIAELAAL